MKQFKCTVCITLPVKTPTDGRPTRPNIDTTEYRRDQTSKKHRQTPTNTENVFYFILPYRKRGSKREVTLIRITI